MKRMDEQSNDLKLMQGQVQTVSTDETNARTSSNNINR